MQTICSQTAACQADQFLGGPDAHNTDAARHDCQAAIWLPIVAFMSAAVTEHDDQQADAVFKALSDRSRRRLLDSLRERDGQTLTELCAGLAMARQSVSKHLAVLEGATLVTTVRRGREKLHYLNPVPINEIADRWISQYDQPRLNALADLKRALESTT